MSGIVRHKQIGVRPQAHELASMRKTSIKGGGWPATPKASVWCIMQTLVRSSKRDPSQRIRDAVGVIWQGYALGQSDRRSGACSAVRNEALNPLMPDQNWSGRYLAKAVVRHTPEGPEPVLPYLVSVFRESKVSHGSSLPKPLLSNPTLARRELYRIGASLKR